MFVAAFMVVCAVTLISAAIRPKKNNALLGLVCIVFLILVVYMAFVPIKILEKTFDIELIPPQLRWVEDANDSEPGPSEPNLCRPILLPDTNEPDPNEPEP